MRGGGGERRARGDIAHKTLKAAAAGFADAFAVVALATAAAFVVFTSPVAAFAAEAGDFAAALGLEVVAAAFGAADFVSVGALAM